MMGLNSDNQITLDVYIEAYLESGYSKKYDSLDVRIRLNKTISIRKPGVWRLRKAEVDPDNKSQICKVLVNTDGEEILFHLDDVEYIKLDETRTKAEVVIKCF